MAFSKQFLKEQEDRLKDQKEKIETQLKGFAKESHEIKGEWEPKITHFNSGNGNLEEEADEVEEFSTNLALSRNMEQELESVNSALGKLKKGKYGVCEKCETDIQQERLNAYPQARYCTKCQN